MNHPPDRDRELDEELRFHLEAEAERQRESGQTEERARQAARRHLGNILQIKEATRVHWSSYRLEQWLLDLQYGWRQIWKNKTTSVAAILSLALGTGACLSAFRLMDALLWRPLPIVEPERLHAVVRHGVGPSGQYRVSESSSYPIYREMRDAVAGYAGLLAVSYAERSDITYQSDAEMEKAYRQYVSGRLFTSFGLRPAVGRLLTEDDDSSPGTHPYAVLSHHYWRTRFGADPAVVGRPFRAGQTQFVIAGVLDGPFTGTETGTMTDIFVPLSMAPATSLENANSFWLRLFLRPGRGEALPALFDRLHAVYVHHEQERAKHFHDFPKELLANYPTDQLLLLPAASGVSTLQSGHRRALQVLGVLAALVLLIACVNTGNLMLTRALGRSREMALRISIGASRGRLVRLVLLESAWIAVLAALLGGVLSWQAAPAVVGWISPPNSPARLDLPLDWRLLAFGGVVTVAITALFGLLPALRASGIRPAGALKGGDESRWRGRVLPAMIAVQVAICAMVLLAGTLLGTSYRHLSEQPVGFDHDRLLAVEAVAKVPQPPVYWTQLADHLRSLPGIRSIEIAEWPLLSGEMSNRFIAFDGAPPVRTLTYFYKVSPGWRESMGIPLLRGRDLRSGDSFPNMALVNETFVRTYLAGREPVGRRFTIPGKDGRRIPVTIAGVTADARYNNMREAIPPIVYAPFLTLDDAGAEQPMRRATLNVRLIQERPEGLPAVLRHEVANFRADFRVTNIRTQQELIEMHTLRERLLAILSLYFSVTALLLATVGLYGVLDYSVSQRRREIGIRLALGASPFRLIHGVTGRILAMAALGAIAGTAAGWQACRYLDNLLSGTPPNAWQLLSPPAAVLLAAALVAAIAPVLRAIRLDPLRTLRTDG